MATAIQLLLKRLQDKQVTTALAPKPLTGIAEVFQRWQGRAPVLRQTTPVSGTRTDPVITVNGAPAPSFLSAPVPSVKELALTNGSSGGTVVDGAQEAKQAENRARLLQIAIAAAVIWVAFNYLDKGR